jgi:acetyl esterase/lipase
MAILPKYRRAPEAQFPAAPQDVRAAWDGLIASGVDPADVILGGDSAGGALAFGLVAALCSEKAAKPSAVFGLSPLTDLTYSGNSFVENADCDVILPSDRASDLTTPYLRGQMANVPEVSPLFADFMGAPPFWMTVGDTEILLDDSRRMTMRLHEQGVSAQLVVAHDVPHVWPLMHNILPEARQTLDTLARWIRQQRNWAV